MTLHYSGHVCNHFSIGAAPQRRSIDTDSPTTQCGYSVDAVTPEPDPEQRIADLERSLAAPEAGTDSAPEASRPGMRLGWIVLGLLIVGLVVSGGVLMAERLNRPVAGRPTSAAAGGGSTSGLPAAPPAATTTPTRPVDAPTASSPATGGPISVAGLDTRKTVACSDNVVSISGVNNTVVLTGRCGRVDVSGIENVVTVEAAGAIAVSGLNNKVTYRSGTPELSNSGIGNTLERG